MKINKSNIFNYSNHKVAHEIKKDFKGRPITINQRYSLDDKIEYYSKRINDSNLSKTQQDYAKVKLLMLTSGIGRIFIVKDHELGNKNEPDKNRRVIPTSINYSNGNTLINGIYTNPSRFASYKINKYDAIEKIYILDKDSYLDVETKKKLDGKYFNIKELSETTSTISPYQLKDVIKYVYPKKEKHDIHVKNNLKRKSLNK